MNGLLNKRFYWLIKQPLSHSLYILLCAQNIFARREGTGTVRCACNIVRHNYTNYDNLIIWDEFQAPLFCYKNVCVQRKSRFQLSLYYGLWNILFVFFAEWDGRMKRFTILYPFVVCYVAPQVQENWRTPYNLKKLNSFDPHTHS